jgi:translocation protein SEC72
MWPRARRFGNVYAFASVDCLYTILWFSAWVCVASYVAQGKSIGKSGDDNKNKDQNSNKNQNSHQTRADDGGDSKSGCDAWAYGSATRCKISTATVILGVVILYGWRSCHSWLPANLPSALFAVTTWMSVNNVKHFRRTGTLPDAVSDPTFAAQSKAAFSSNPAQDFEEEDDFRSGRGGGLGSSVRGDRDEDYALLQQNEADEMGSAQGRSAMHGAYDPTAPGPGGVLHDYNTGYGGAHGQHYAPPTEYGSSVSGYGP